MIYPKESLLKPLAATVRVCLLLLGMAAWQHVQAQCTIPVTHQSGTVMIGCTAVTVTPDGITGTASNCGISPYRIGGLTSPAGSYTFTFSPPVSGVTVDLFGVNNWVTYSEEVSFEVNGVFYPITIPGTASNTCPQFPVCIILPNGRVSAPNTNDIACIWEDQPINETITTIKIENIPIIGNAIGIVAGLRFCEACCQTDAGVLSGGPLQVCLPQSASFAPAAQTNLEPDDLLQYVLYTNVNDPAGSILAVSNTPEFVFNPATMQTGVTYYVAAMAGNEVNGNVDLNDYCLDFSNALTLVWQPSPAVAFTAPNLEVCTGECLTFNVALTGTPPFSLTYTTGSGGPQTQTFGANTGTLQICPPAGTPTGNLTLAAVSLTDGNCVCD